MATTTSRDSIRNAIDTASQGIERIQLVMNALAELAEAIPETDRAIGTVNVRMESGQCAIHVHPSWHTPVTGFDVMKVLADAGLVFQRSHNSETGAVYYEAELAGYRLIVIGYADPTCEVVEVLEQKDVARYELRCPNAAEVVA